MTPKLIASVALLFLLACSGGSPTATTSPTAPEGAPTSMGVFRALKATAAPQQGVMAASSNESVAMTRARKTHRGILLKNGKVLVLGGEYDADGLWATIPSTGELFDPQTERFTASNANFKYRYERNRTTTSFDFVTLPDGRVLIAGGLTPGAYVGTTSLMVYDPHTDSATELTGVFPGEVLSVEHGFYLDGNKVLFTGLRNPLDLLKNKWEFYDYAIIYDVSKHTSEMIPHPYNYMDSAVCEDANNIYFIGGCTPDTGWNNPNRDSFADVVKFDRHDKVFTKVGSLLSPKHGMGLVKLEHDRVGVYGGVSWHGVPSLGEITRLKEVEVVDLKQNTATFKAPLLSAVAWMDSIALQGTPYTLHAGGVDHEGLTAKNQYVHNADANLSGSTGTLVEARRLHAVIALNNGLVLITGGENEQMHSTKATAEIYDAQSKMFVNFVTDQIQAGEIINFTCTKDVTWSVAPEDTAITEGFGSIDSSTGVYTSDTSNPVTLIVMVTATLKSDPTVQVSVRVKVFGVVPTT